MRISSSSSACVFGRGFSFGCVLVLAGVSMSIFPILARATFAPPPEGFAAFFDATVLALVAEVFGLPSREASTSPGLPFFFSAARCFSSSLNCKLRLTGESEPETEIDLQLLSMLFTSLAAPTQSREQLETRRLAIVFLRRRCRPLRRRRLLLLRLLRLHRCYAARDGGGRSDGRMRVRRGEDMVNRERVGCRQHRRLNQPIITTLTPIDELSGELFADALRISVGSNLHEERAEEAAGTVVQRSHSNAGRDQSNRVGNEEFLRIVSSWFVTYWHQTWLDPLLITRKTIVSISPRRRRKMHSDTATKPAVRNSQLDQAREHQGEVQRREGRRASRQKNTGRIGHGLDISVETRASKVEDIVGDGGMSGSKSREGLRCR